MRKFYILQLLVCVIMFSSRRKPPKIPIIRYLMTILCSEILWLWLKWFLSPSFFFFMITPFFIRDRNFRKYSFEVTPPPCFQAWHGSESFLISSSWAEKHKNKFLVFRSWSVFTHMHSSHDSSSYCMYVHIKIRHFASMVNNKKKFRLFEIEAWYWRDCKYSCSRKRNDRYI